VWYLGRGRAWSLAPYVALLMVASALTVYAWRADGDDAHTPRLHDSGVWVVSDQESSFGRFDKAIGQLDATYWAESGQAGQGGLDVVQEDAAVVGVDESRATVYAIDPARVEPPEGEQAQVPAEAEVDLRGGTLAVADPEKGTVWGTRADPVTGRATTVGIGPEEDPLTTAGGPETRVAVTEQGSVLALSATAGTLMTVPATGDTFGAAEPTELGALRSDTQLTAVGEQPVLLDGEGTLSAVGGVSTSVGPGAVLQQPGPSADGVLVATPDKLLEVDLESGAVATLGETDDGAEGTPIRPVRLGSCGYAAWEGAAAGVLTHCDGDGGTFQPLTLTSGSELAFRVNRGQIVLNDSNDGTVWDVDAQQLTTPDNWLAFRPQEDPKGTPEEQQQEAGERRDPVAVDDTVRARPGRLTVLHPLDNDIAPAGTVITIARVSSVSGGEVTVSPNGQLVQVRLAGGGPLSFDYTLTDGKDDGLPARARVRVQPVQGNEAPQLRKAYVAPQPAVASGAVLDVPVIADWRDPEGDPVSLESAEASAGSARVVDGGIIRFTAPTAAGPVTLRYQVGDGRSASPAELTVQVQGPTDPDTVAPVAHPDIAAGPAGSPIEISPLANDLAGSDPGDPDAELTLMGQVLAPPGAEVVTDVDNGTITVTSEAPGSYLLDYQAGFGNATPDQGLIRVDVTGGAQEPPVAMTDQVDLHGSEGAVVDVLANDGDPAGGVLTVTEVGADTGATETLEATVVEGRYVRVASAAGTGGGPATLTYTISNGYAEATGEIVVTPHPAPEDPSPVTAVDRVTVRAGSPVEVPVLDNDADPQGGPLHLITDVVPDRAGVLVARDADGGTDPATAGQATVRGDLVRYVAPTVEESGTVTVEYVAAGSDGSTGTGRLIVDVVGSDETPTPPTPPRLESRVSAGGSVEVSLPGSGADPDGDAVSITGLGRPPELGRVVETRADALTYQAYPDTQGTDEFEYELTDEHGQTATGTVRIGVVPMSLPEPPQAVPDELTAAPGSRVVVDVAANDHVDVGSQAEVALLDANGPAELVASRGTLVAVQVPDQEGGTPEDVRVAYRLSNGTGSTTSSITVHPVEGFNAPPVVDDVQVEQGPSDTVRVDLLANAYDPDGDTDDLRVVGIGRPQAVVRREGRQATIARRAVPLVVPFRVSDGAGGVTSAAVYVAPSVDNRPRLRDDALVELAPGGSSTEQLADYVTAGGAGEGGVRFSVDRLVWFSSGVTLDPVGPRSFEIAAEPGFTGPAAVGFEVTSSAGGTAAPGRTGVVTVPVQVGRTRPVLTCPTEPVTISHGEKLEVPVDSLCHVWTDPSDPNDASGLQLRAEMASGQDLDAGVDGLTVSVAAGEQARGRGVLELSAVARGVSSSVVRVPVKVAAAPPPRLAPIQVSDLEAGQRRTIDLGEFFDPGITGSRGRLLAVSGDRGVTVERLDGTRVRLSARPGISGRRTLPVRMTDVAAGERPAGRRVVESRIGVEILDRPGRPPAPAAGRVIRSHEVQLSWRAPAANGAPIDRYRIRGAGRTWTCRSTSCAATGLTNGRTYAFTVEAHNAVGWSRPSPLSRRAPADARPGAVGGIHLVRVGDGRLTLRWSRPTKQTSIDGYRVSWPGGVKKASGTSATIGGLDNSTSRTFTVAAVNETVGVGVPRRTGRLQTIGKPRQPGRPSVHHQETQSDTAAVRVSWGAVDPNGPGPARYTVYRGSRPVSGCRSITRTSCSVGGLPQDGTAQRFHVRVRNAGVRGVPGGAARSSTGNVTAKRLVGIPAPWRGYGFRPTGKDGQVRVNGTIPDSHGRVTALHWIVDGHDRTPGWRTTRTQLGVNLRVGNDTWADRGPHRVKMRVCNEHGHCSETQERRVQTYGTVRFEHIISVWAERKGPRIRWHLQVDGNGQWARASFVRTNRHTGAKTSNFFSTEGPGTRRYLTSWRRIGYSHRETIKVTLRDSDRDRCCQRTRTETRSTNQR